MKKRKAFVLAAVFAAAVLVAVLLKKESPPQIITLQNGDQYEFIAAEWGTNEIQPTFAARFVARLPTPLANYILRKYGNRLGIVTPVSSGLWLSVGTTKIPYSPPPPEPALHFWFRSLSTNTTTVGPLDFNVTFLLADKDGVVAGRGNRSQIGIYGQGTDRWLTTTQPMVPRRSEMLQLHLFQGRGLIGTVRFRNPLFGRFPDWQPEPLPDEAAWRLKLTLKRSRGFDPEELVTFANVPVLAAGAANITFTTNLIQGVQVIMQQRFVRNSGAVMDASGAGMAPTYVVVEAINPPEGFVVDYKELKADTGWTARETSASSRRTTNSATVYLSSIPADVRTLDISWTVQKTRTVEYLVKPPKAE